MVVSKKFLSAVLSLALAGCATAMKPVPPTPSPKPALAPVVAPAAKPAPAPVKAPAPKKPVDQSARPSIAATKTVAFDGGRFAAKYHTADKSQAVTWYCLANQTSDSWTRLVELHVYPLKGIAPADYAQAVGKQAQQANPSIHYLVYPNKADGAAILDYLTWNDADLKASRLELNIFKFYTDAATGDLIGFHYAERVKLDPKASSADNSKKVPAVRQRVLPEIAATPLYRE